MLPHMLLIASALSEELQTALNLCSSRRKLLGMGVPIWTGARRGQSFCMLKLGVGPVRSALALQRALAAIRPAQILVVGYAGALAPDLKQGELVAVDNAALLPGMTWGASLSEVALVETWPLAGAEELSRLAQGAGLPSRRGKALTSFSIIGKPDHKRVLFQRFQTEVVDMETAALARVASEAATPLYCVRAVADEADDDFLAALSHNPGAGRLQRAAAIIADGHWLRHYGLWRERSQAARRSLSKFLSCYLDQGMMKNE